MKVKVKVFQKVQKVLAPKMKVLN